MGTSRPAAQSSDIPSLVSDHDVTSLSNPPDQPPRQLVPHTTFSLRYRWYLTLLLGYLCLASSLTANIYFPLLTLLAEDYNTTITLYVAIQGVAPSIFSPLSDTLGRRPVYLMSFSLYAIASLGLAFSESNYVALLLLRAMQSMGGSATLSLAYAVVADYTVHAERGKFLSPMMTATNIGPCIGPVIGGGAILATGRTRWAFWTLTIFGGTALTLIAFTMRETNRSIVGNGEVQAKGLWRSWADIILSWKVGEKSTIAEKKSQEDDLDRKNASNPRDCTTDSTTHINAGKTGKGIMKIPNPFVSLRLLFNKDAAVVLYLAASPYASWYTITTSIPSIYRVEYGFNDLVVGCCYLAGGAGILSGGLIAGRLMDWNYKVTARNSGMVVDRIAGDDIRIFPIERARSRGSYLILFFSSFAFAGYGWAVQFHIHPAVSLILQFYLGCKCTVLHQTYSTLLVDMFPDNPGTAGASNNICRCALSAALIAALQPCVDAIGRGWFFTMIGLWDGVGSICAAYTTRRWGPRWRQERLERW